MHYGFWFWFVMEEGIKTSISIFFSAVHQQHNFIFQNNLAYPDVGNLQSIKDFLKFTASWILRFLSMHWVNAHFKKEQNK